MELGSPQLLTAPTFSMEVILVWPRKPLPPLLKVAGTLALVALSLAADAWAGPKYKVLHSFGTGKGGGGLWGSLTLDQKGNLYGTTIGGGRHDRGTVFELTHRADDLWTETVLHGFDGNDGDFPFAGGLVFDVQGRLYGTARGGGPHGGGTVFQLKPGSRGWTFSVLYDSGSNAGLILDPAGNLYGTTEGGGKYGNGAIFELTPSSDGWTDNVLYSFCPKTPCLDGDTPYAGLTWDTAGNLYGTTEYGGKGVGGDWATVFGLEHTYIHRMEAPSPSQLPSISG
jgi:uncharacterized repeat protein (TIGR03803 family)